MSASVAEVFVAGDVIFLASDNAFCVIFVIAALVALVLFAVAVIHERGGRADAKDVAKTRETKATTRLASASAGNVRETRLTAQA